MNDASRLLEITPRTGTLQIDNWAEWWSAFAQRTTWLDALALALGALLAWLLVRWLGAWAARVAGQLRAARHEADGAGSGAAGQSRLSVLFGTRQVDGALFPLFWLGLTYLERMALLHWVGHAPLLRLALPALTALLLIRSVATVLRAALPGVAAVRLLERTVSWAAWMGMLLWVSGVLPAVMRQLDTITWKMGGTQMTVTDLIEGALIAGALMLLALWASSYLEERLLRQATGATLSVRKAVAKATRAFMLFLGLMLGLSAVGIDLTALSVLGGAMGVGIGFGLQKLAASYISGFLVLAERSLRIGDLVRVGGFDCRHSHALHRDSRRQRLRSAGAQRNTDDQHGGKPVVFRLAPEPEHNHHRGLRQRRRPGAAPAGASRAAMFARAAPARASRAAEQLWRRRAGVHPELLAG